MPYMEVMSCYISYIDTVYNTWDLLWRDTEYGYV